MQAVVLDVGGVLLLPHPEAVERVLQAAGLDVNIEPETVVRAHYQAVQAFDAADDIQTGGRAYFGTFASGLGVSVEALKGLQKLSALEIWRLLVPGALDGLNALAELGCKLAIISNSDGSVEAQLLEHRICQVGEGAGVPMLAIVDSGVLGIAKPDPRIFHHAAGLLEVAPEQCLYVGDMRRYDVVGAQAAGMRAVHFDPFGLCGAPDGHEHVRQLMEVADLVQETRA